MCRWMAWHGKPVHVVTVNDYLARRDAESHKRVERRALLLRQVNAPFVVVLGVVGQFPNGPQAARKERKFGGHCHRQLIFCCGLVVDRACHHAQIL